jgi:hypothetical protein
VARCDRLHEYHQILGGYSQMILLYAQALKLEQYKVVLLKMLYSGLRLKQKGKISQVQSNLKGTMC